MKKIFIVAIATIAIITSCKKDNDTNTDITYNAAYIVNGSSNSISVINLSNNTVARTINLTGVSYPHHIALSPDKTKIIVGVPGMDLSNGHSNIMAGMTGMFVVLDAVTGNTLKTKPTNDEPQRYLLTKRHRNLDFTNGQYGQSISI